MKFNNTLKFKAFMSGFPVVKDPIILNFKL